MVALNLACGIYYISNLDWVNVDWEANSPHVQQMDLTNSLRLESESFDFVYTSHFIEHLTLLQAEMLLKECYRILSPGGIIRIVTPDFEKYCKEYLSQIDSGNKLNAEFLKSTLIDQMVRTTPGGESGAWGKVLENNVDLQNFKAYWIGSSQNRKQSLQIARSITKSLYRKMKQIFKNPQMIKRNLIWKYCKFVGLLYPKWFRNQHIIFSRPGERHLYLFDFDSLKKLMEIIGFADVIRTSAKATTSLRSDLHILDLDLDGNPRKGEESMFVEARKPE